MPVPVPVPCFTSAIYCRSEYILLTPFDSIKSALNTFVPLHYYIIYRTVLLPNTFVYPVEGRFRPVIQDDEDSAFIISDDPGLTTSFTQNDLFQYLTDASTREQNGRPVPVRSCFGGLAIYRTSVWYEPKCQYGSWRNKCAPHMARYANQADKRPCEHVSFHECLREVIPATLKGSDLSIGIQPRLMPHWNSNNEIFTSELTSDDNNAIVTTHNQAQLDNRPGLGAFAAKESSRRRLNEASSLLTSSNKKYHLRIDPLHGHLLLENHEKKGVDTNPTVVWKAAVIETEAPAASWMMPGILVRSSLTIRRGTIVLEREVVNSRDDGTTICDSMQRTCSFEIWSSNRETNSDQRDILTPSTSALALSDTGSLSLVDKKTQQISWTATEDIIWPSCPSQIPSTFRLHRGDTICSPNDQYRLRLQDDGLFVWKATDVEKDGAETTSASERTTLASFKPSGPGPVIAQMQGDGNMVILRMNEDDEPTVVWSSNTPSVETQGAHVELFDDGSVGIVNAEEDAVKFITPEANGTSSKKPDTSVLGIGESLRCGGSISSPKGDNSVDPCVYDFGLSKECVLELRCVESNGKSTVLWSVEQSKSVGEQSSLIMQDDGNLVLYGHSMTDSIWSTKTLGSSAMLSIKSNGKVEMRNLEDEILWYLSRDGIVRPRNVLRSDEQLSVGDLICSPQGSFCFGLHEETQDLRLWRVRDDSENKNQDKDESSVIFALEDGNLHDPAKTLVMQDDGNLVLRTKSDVLWTSESDGDANRGSELYVLDYGAAEIRNQDGVAVRTFTVGPRIVLKSDEELRAGEYICSSEGNTCFGIHEETQDLRLWRVTDGDGEVDLSVIFALEDGNLSDVDASLIMQEDGNLVLRTKSDVLWSSESDGDANHGSELYVFDYGAAEIRNQQGIAIHSFAFNHSAGGRSCSRWLFGEEWLRGNKKSICSPNGKYKLRLSPENQDLAVFDDVGSIFWSLGIESDEDVRVHLQNDGNLIYEDKEGSILWHSGVTTRSSNGVGLTITDDGAVMLFDFDGTLIWSSDDDKLASDREKKAAGDTSALSSLYLPGCGCADALYPGQLLNLTTNDFSLCSPDATHRFGFDSGTGDLSIWRSDEKVWSRGLFSPQKEAHRTAELTHGGNLVVREGRLVVIDTGTDADTVNTGATISIDNDGMVRLKNSKGKETILINPLLSESPGQDDKSPLIADESNSAGVIDSSSLKGKVLTGYQGWFTTPCDDGLKRWHHWSNRVIPNDKTVTVDMWPTIDEYDADELCDTDFVLQGSTKARLFSSYNPKTVDRHIKWMSEYGIDGAVVQRFIADIRVFRHMRDQVLKNVQTSSERYGRVFANMYDITGLEPSPSILEDIMNDWKHLVDGLKVTESPRYLRSNNLPVLGVYFGKASKTPLTAKETSTLIDWLQNNPEERYRATVIGAGLGKDWRTTSSPEWRAVYEKLDVISPWTVGIYSDEAAFDQHYEKFQASDVEFCHNNKQEYLPVVFPGFSAKQIMDGKPMNEIPRNGGEFLWRQLFQSARSGAGMVYVAMFDEYDEGTAIMKAAAARKDAPINGDFVTFDVDKNYQEIPNDWYLRLVGEATKLFRKDAKNFPDTIPMQISVSTE